MKKTINFVCACAVLLMLAGCPKDAAVEDKPKTAAAKQQAAAEKLAAEGAEKKYRVTLIPNPMPPKVNEFFVVDAVVVDAKENVPVPGARVTIDATMPSHGHGMITAPKNKELGAGKYQAEGMKFHMHGAWEFTVEIDGPAGKDKVRIPFEQPPTASK